MSESTTTIKLGNNTQRFYQGVAAGTKVAEAHADQPIPDFRTRLNLFWFYVGAVAADEYGCQEPDEFAAFIAGATTRAPREYSDEDATLTVTYRGVSHQFPADPEADVYAPDQFFRFVTVTPSA